jgi:predicted PhzF superfamily epimerase YddE/YHI9
VPIASFGRHRFDALVELECEEAVRRLAPDIGLLAEIPLHGVIVTSRASTPGYDFISRFFAPRLGVAEDPVCGSAHRALGPFWGGLLVLQLKFFDLREPPDSGMNR